MKFESAAVRKLTPYQYGEQPPDPNKTIKLNTNENPYPPHPALAKTLGSFNADLLRFYPDPECRKLREAAAAFYAVRPEEIAFGNGSDEILSLIFRVFFDTHTKAVFTQYTYSAYHTYAAAGGIEQLQLPMESDFKIDMNRMPDAAPAVFFLTNPNAPTGMVLGTADISSFIKKNPRILFVVDEAYADFAGITMIPFINELPNLIVIRTLSKAFSFCGGRLGYMIANEDLIGSIGKVRDSYNIDLITQHLGEQIFLNTDYYLKNIETIKNDRSKFSAELSRLGCSLLPSAANFVFVKFGKEKAKALYLYLKTKKIYVRFFEQPLLDEYLRISIGTAEQMERVVQEIKTFLKSSPD